jgi:hypothetical protein
MKDRIRFIEHKGQQIMLVDFTNCSSKEVLAIVAEVREQIPEHPRNSLLTLADYTGSEVDKPVAMRIKETLVLDRPYVKRSAWVGTEHLPHVFYENFKSFSQREFPLFKTREEAMDWLVKGD